MGLGRGTTCSRLGASGCCMRVIAPRCLLRSWSFDLGSDAFWVGRSMADHPFRAYYLDPFQGPESVQVRPLGNPIWVWNGRVRLVGSQTVSDERSTAPRTNRRFWLALSFQTPLGCLQRPCPAGKDTARSHWSSKYCYVANLRIGIWRAFAEVG